jgi:hypothetical protein
MRERSTRRRAKRVERRAWVVALALSAVIGCATPAQAEHPMVRGTGIVFDLIIVRPLGLGELIFGFICFAPAALFAGRSIEDPWEHFVLQPYEATFVRPLGEFDEEY